MRTKQLYGSSATITNAVKYLESQGKSVIGGTNADFFVMSSGVPIGLVIDEGGADLIRRMAVCGRLQGGRLGRDGPSDHEYDGFRRKRHGFCVLFQ